MELASAEVDVILQAGTAIAFFRGFGHDPELSRRITATQGSKRQHRSRRWSKPCAFSESSSRRLPLRISLTSTHVFVDVLEKSGFTVAAIKGMGIKRSIDMGKVEPDETYRLAEQVARSAPGADGILISCGNLRSFEVIEPLETDTGLPVVTSNQAGLWQALRLVGVNERLPNLGRLLRNH